MSIFSDVFGTGPATTTTNTAAQVPPEVEARRKEIIDLAGRIAAEPYAAYEQPRIAGFTADQLAGFEAARNVAETGGALSALTPDLTQRGISAIENMAVALPDADISKYMSPYTEAVLDPAIRDIEEKAARERLRLGQQSARTGSFGGSRQAIAESELERGTQRAVGEESAKQRAAAYNNALAQFRLDQQNIPNLYKSSMGLLSEGLDQNASRLTTEVNPILAIGAAQQGLDQRNLDLLYQNFQEQRDYPKTALDVLKSSVTLQPTVIGAGTTQTQTPPAPNVAGSIISGIAQAPQFIQGAQTLIDFFGGGGGSTKGI
jgi:hypothetical protein